MKHRVHTPTLLQLEAVECGAASLGIVLGYLGRTESLETLRAACNVSRDGSSAASVLRAARSFGLIAHGKRAEIEDLGALKLPFIVFWNFNHFLVVEGFDRERFYLNDPAVGPRTVSPQEFDEAFTGVVLTFERGPDFRRGGHREGAIGSLARRLAGSESGLLYCVFAGIGLVVPSLAVSVFLKIFVDDYLTRGYANWAVPLLIAVGLSAILQMALSLLQQHYLLRLKMKLAISMSANFVWHVLRLPMTFFAQRFSGDINFRISLNDQVAELLSAQLATNLISSFTLIFYLAMMLFYSVSLTIIVVFMAGFNVLMLRLVARARNDASNRLVQQQGKMLGTAMNGLQMIETLKATGSESEFFSRWAGYATRVTNSRQDLALPTMVLSNMPALITLLNAAIILAVGGLRVMDGSLSIGTLVAFQSLTLSFMFPINNLVNLAGDIQQMQANLKRLDDVLENRVDETLERGAGNGAAVKLEGALELRDVTFGYSATAEPLIKNFDLKLLPGERVAVVGRSGSGKSTVARLVSGLFAPWSGQILLDGTSRDELDRPTISNSLGLVEQDVYLFEGTIRDNLTLWNRTISDAQVVQGAKDACVHDTITGRPDGYDAEVSEGGRNFSGGQAQRIEIARALARDPSILILDEATSALDPLTELHLSENLRRRGCTCLIIAHRLSTIRDCDQIVVLDKGAVVQRGTHEELVAQPGLYAELVSGTED
ncbi:MAG: NHLP family bacteriocin export ABC transporter peptidase/permease/ATPase subunit [Candidatus Meridianibacter frigidus]|nr:MAG: NHLP family bacteriocin export ABC transporter peptidase/permease/ATPase subunit [Candidatus Eremiobacteraeota bacterium]